MASVSLQSQPVLALERSQVATQAKEFTVRIEGKETTGTGTIIEQSGDTYTILTCWHVVNAEGSFEVTTVDGEVHQVTVVKNLDDIDLATLQFSSNTSYQVAELGDSQTVTAGTSSYNEAIRLDPEYATAYYNRGTTYRDLEENKKAIADYNEAIRLNPEYVYAYNNRGISYYNLAKYDQAIADYSESIRLN